MVKETGLSRRNVLMSSVGAASIAAFGLVGCDSNTTVQGILDWVKTNCGFATTAQAVVQVILTVVSTFNAAAGAAASVAVGVADQVEKAICDAVTAKVAQLKDSGKLAATHEVSVVVNGVTVTGTLVK